MLGFIKYGKEKIFDEVKDLTAYPIDFEFDTNKAKGFNLLIISVAVQDQDRNEKQVIQQVLL